MALAHRLACIVPIPLLAVVAIGCEGGSGCNDPVDEITVNFDVSVLVKDQKGDPVPERALKVDIFKEQCDGKAKRVVGAPWNGTTDPQGSYDVPARVGYTLHDGKDSVELSAEVFEQGIKLAGSDYSHLSYWKLTPYAGGVMPYQLNVVIMSN